MYDLETTEVRFEFSVEQLGEPSFLGGRIKKASGLPKERQATKKMANGGGAVS